jgi:hypothetical protein
LQPIIPARLPHFIHSEYAIDISLDTLRRPQARSQDRSSVGRPMETHRVQVTADAFTIIELREFDHTLDDALGLDEMAESEDVASFPI